MDGKMALDGLTPSAAALLSGVILDALIGDPRYPLHPIRLMGATLAAFETLLRRLGLDGYIGGCVLFLLLTITWVLIPCTIVHEITIRNSRAGFALLVFVVYSLFALRDLFDHVRMVQRAARHDDIN